jgi:ribosomal protein S18 acetylase RimI-like enzyme
MSTVLDADTGSRLGWRICLADLRDGGAAARAAAAFLHAMILPGSPVVRLGHRFMTEYYYRDLVEEGLLGAFVAWVDDQPAGFVAYTQRPHDFMVEGLRRHPLKIASLVGGAFLARPSRVLVVGRALGILKRRRDDLATGPAYDAEILSLGVLPQYRSPAFRRATGRHLGRELFERAVERIRADGGRRVGTLVEARDLETAVFLHSLGCRFHREWVDGADCYEILYVVS